MSDWHSYNNKKEIELRNNLAAFVLGSGVGFLYTIECRNEQNKTVNTAGPTEIDISKNKNGNNIPYVMGILAPYFTDPEIMVGWEAKYDSEHNNAVHVRIIQHHLGSTVRD
jgi:hypothetical protein